MNDLQTQLEELAALQARYETLQRESTMEKPLRQQKARLWEDIETLAAGIDFAALAERLEALRPQTRAK